MCEFHSIYHLCGHIKIKTIIQCAELIASLTSPSSNLKSGPISSHQSCDDACDEIHIFPDVCEKCKATGVLGEVMKSDKGTQTKIEVLREWRRKHPKGFKGLLAEKETSAIDERQPNAESAPRMNQPEQLTAAQNTELSSDSGYTMDSRADSAASITLDSLSSYTSPASATNSTSTNGKHPEPSFIPSKSEYQF